MRTSELSLSVPGQRGKPPMSRGKPSGHNGRHGHAVFVYAAYCKGYAKIGISEDPKTRVRNMQCGCPFPIELLTSVPLAKDAAVAAEMSIMDGLNAAHWFGDWFKCTRNQALYAIERGVSVFSGADVPPIKGTEIKPPRLHPTRHPSLRRRIITPDGIFESSADAAERYGISRQAAHQKATRKSQGWRFENDLSPDTLDNRERS